jgi:phosphoribosyl-AMP cyclohydrolase / phosphoribosyl-ATP pyrophosphohydrolase
MNSPIEGVDDLDRLRFDEAGLIPVVVQEERSNVVLMVAWANREALALTLETGAMHYWSRSRSELWRKGATSGNTQALVSLHADCDADTLLARVRQTGPACHTGATSCFGTDEGDTIGRLWALLESRARERPEGSYTVRLLDDENLRLKKLGEETAELLTALAKGEPRASEEAADLVYHLMVALLGAGRSWSEVVEALEQRGG